ncbi:MAG: helix-turn-helix domain-containing protein [Solirubrobacterales bacterium]
MDKGKETERGKALAVLVKSAREEAGVSQRACAAATGVQVSWLQRMELGQFDRPDASRMARLVGFLPIDPDRLLEISGDYIPNELPDVRAYLRTKYGASDKEIAQFDDYVAHIEQGRSARKAKPKPRKAARKQEVPT